MHVDGESTVLDWVCKMLSKDGATPRVLLDSSKMQTRLVPYCKQLELLVRNFGDHGHGGI